MRDCTGYAAQQGEFTAYPVQSRFLWPGPGVDNFCGHAPADAFASHHTAAELWGGVVPHAGPPASPAVPPASSGRV